MNYKCEAKPYEFITWCIQRNTLRNSAELHTKKLLGGELVVFSESMYIRETIYIQLTAAKTHKNSFLSNTVIIYRTYLHYYILQNLQMCKVKLEYIDKI